MSLPVGHALVGSLVFAALDRHVTFVSRRTAWLLTLTLPSLPDLDFAFVWFLGWPSAQWHRTFSHSLFFAAGLGALAALWVRTRGRPRPGVAFLFVGLLVASHAFVDMVGYGPGGPGGGVMLLWPGSTRFYEFGWQFLPPGTGDSFLWYLRTAWMELFILGPPVAIVWAFKRRAPPGGPRE